MDKNKITILLFLAILFVAWGGYKIARATYIAISWEKTQGTIVDFERNTWSCGKGVGTCYTLVAGYHAGNNYYTVMSEKKFNYNKPSHLLEKKIDIYYYPLNPAEATFGGAYGSMSGGIILFVVGMVLLVVFWFIRKKA